MFRSSSFAFASALFASFVLSGCEKPPAANTDAAHEEAGGSSGHQEEAGHTADDGHDHAHPDEGPHHGHLIELGNEEYHAELTHDDASGAVAIYLLDESAKSPVAIADAEIMLNLLVDGKARQIALAAEPQENDPEGQSSRFSITDEAIVEALEAEETTGKLNVTIEGKRYTGAIDHHAHGEHEHEGHDEEGHDHGEGDHEGHDDE